MVICGTRIKKLHPTVVDWVKFKRNFSLKCALTLEMSWYMQKALRLLIVHKYGKMKDIRATTTEFGRGTWKKCKGARLFCFWVWFCEIPDLLFFEEGLRKPFMFYLNARIGICIIQTSKQGF